MMYSHVEADGTVLTAVHCKAQSYLPVVDRLIEPQTLINFIGFAFGAPLPNGNQPDVERLSDEEFPFIQQDQNFPPGTNGESIVTRVMRRIGSEDDFARLCLVGKNIQFLKSRLWQGIIPLSEQLWQEKELNHPKNLDLACQHLSAVIAVFQYLNKRVVRSHLRDTFNYIYDHWATLDTFLNERRSEKGQPPISVAGLWTMYMTAHYEMVTERAHRWVIVHVNTLRAPLLKTLFSHRQEGLGDNQPDRLQWQLTDSLQVLAEIAANADYTIMIPMNDYKGYTIPQRDHATALRAADLGTRAKAYHERLKLVTRQAFLRIVPSEENPNSYGESLHQTARSQLEAQSQVRIETRGPPIEPIPREPWIISCVSRIESETKTETEQMFGMAVYRLTYGQTESEWTEFVEKVEAHVSDWGKGQTGSSAVKAQLKLHWLDGKELGISEGDLDAAKIHFRTLTNDSDVWSNLEDAAFLAVDSASYASYTTESYGPATLQVLAGDFNGFLLAVDPDFDPKEGIERPDESPGYSGQMRILGSLVWGDLFSRLSSQSAYLEDLWPLAIEHPNLVYVGPTVPLQRVAWKEHRDIRWALLRAVIDHVKLKLGMPVTTPPIQAASTATPPTASSAAAPRDAPQSHPPPPASEPSPNPPADQSPFDAALRTYLLSDFQRYLRSEGQTVPAAMAEELLRIQPNERPDPARIQQWVTAEEQRQEQRRQNGEEDEASQEYHPQCPSQ